MILLIIFLMSVSGYCGFRQGRSKDQKTDKRKVEDLLHILEIDYVVSENGKFIDIAVPPGIWGSNTKMHSKIGGRVGLSASFCFDRETDEFLTLSLNGRVKLLDKIDLYEQSLEEFVRCKFHDDEKCACWHNANVAYSKGLAISDVRNHPCC